MKITTVLPAIIIIFIVLLLSGIAVGVAGHQVIASKMILSAFAFSIVGGVVDLAVFALIDLIKKGK